jgi:hypothetical protein
MSINFFYKYFICFKIFWKKLKKIFFFSLYRYLSINQISSVFIEDGTILIDPAPNSTFKNFPILEINPDLP